MIGGILSKFIGPRVLMGVCAVLALSTGLTFAWAKSASSKAIIASEQLNAALAANAELDMAITRLQAERAKVERVLTDREKTLKALTGKHQKLVQRLGELQSAESQIWLNTNIPVDALNLLRESEGADDCKGRKDTTPRCAAT